MVAHAAAFLGVSALVIVTPGQDTALTIRNTLTRGRPGGIQTATGVALGQLVWALSASVGVAAVLRAWEPAFVALRLAGAAYLLYLGAVALRSALSRARPDPLPNRQKSDPLRQGLLTNLANPKMAIFFTSLLPQFAPHGSFATLFGLGAVFCAMTLVWLSAYAVVVSKAGALLRRSGLRRGIEAVTGTVLVAFGLRLATTA